MSLILSGTDGLSDVDGSAATPAIRGTDANTGIFFPAADTIAFAEGGVEAARFDSSGNFGIGTSSPSFKLDVAGGGVRIIPSGGSANSPESGAGTLNVYGATSSITTRTGALRLETFSNMAADVGTGISFSTRYITSPNDGSYTIAKIGGYKENATTNNGAGYLAFATSTGPGDLTERARIDSSGNLGIGVTSSGAALEIKRNTGNIAYFYNNAGTGVALAAGNTSWSAISDERVKDIIEPIANAAEKVSTLRAVIGKYKSDEDGTRRSFLIAQDVQAVLPEAISPWKLPDDETEYLGVQYTDVIPLLVAAIQEQQALITQLTARITALESA
jgi:hypothetical protein